MGRKHDSDMSVLLYIILKYKLKVVKFKIEPQILRFLSTFRDHYCGRGFREKLVYKDDPERQVGFQRQNPKEGMLGQGA